MPFDWMQATIPPAVLLRGATARRAMYIEEVRQRAALFLRLGYTQEHAARRCAGNLDWGCPRGGSRPLSDAEVERIVAEAYAR